jgi:hypothetical protein
VAHGCEQPLLTISAPSQALLQMKQLLLQLGPATEGVLKSALQFLQARGFKQQFELAERELRDSLQQLSAVLQFSGKVRPTGWLPDGV